MYYPDHPKTVVIRPLPKKKTELAGLHPVLTRILSVRGLTSNAELDRTLAALPSPWLLSGMTDMVALLANALRKQERITVVADFDADGATSCAVAVRGLKLFGAEQVSFVVPNRFEYGYGLTPEIVDLAYRQRPDVLITVDNGISSHDGVLAASRLGIKVLITDHHLPGDTLPAADAIVNPALSGSAFPSRALAGVGVIFYVLTALRGTLREQKYFQDRNIPEPNLAKLLDLVALGTVADVVELDKINRALVHQGVLRIRSGHCIPGLKALLAVAGRNPALLTAADLGFAVGPRLNAAGRLNDMSLGIRCLLTDDMETAGELARQLDELNAGRKEIEDQMKREALGLLKEMKKLDERHLPVGLCLFDANWHQGVIGILASRLKDRLHRPVIAFAAAGKDEIKGSARSIPGVHIRDVLSDIAALHPKLLTKFGGHAMAAGLSLKMHDYPPFALAFDDMVRKRIAAADLEPKIFTDGMLEESEISVEFAELLQNAATWGQAFPEPCFEGEFEVMQVRIVGHRHLKWVLRLAGRGQPLDAIAFFVDHAEQWLGARSIRAVYRLDVNEFRGVRSVQLVLQYVERVA